MMNSEWEGVYLPVMRLELLPGVTTLFRDFTEGLSLVPLITLAFYLFL